ncbi:hypothetical protein PROFUN_07541 [Planoprotostelium fungivorum]|uniref:Uncharacterized protein n=1 Tax=Planoprotostelium fungivorum TaxID=1890364 RepID=A0A2P6NLP9_9EUKA|nr:hypothetical protein PROFUN_07541 [Planoprotostelium fungivorum]
MSTNRLARSWPLVHFRNILLQSLKKYTAHDISCNTFHVKQVGKRQHTPYFWTTVSEPAQADQCIDYIRRGSATYGYKSTKLELHNITSEQIYCQQSWTHNITADLWVKGGLTDLTPISHLKMLEGMRKIVLFLWIVSQMLVIL